MPIIALKKKNNGEYFVYIINKNTNKNITEPKFETNFGIYCTFPDNMSFEKGIAFLKRKAIANLRKEQTLIEKEIIAIKKMDINL